MTVKVKVSLDEWTTVRKDADAELMTDGLSGCVAFAIRSNDKIGLAHVYSGAADDLGAYKEKLAVFIEKMGGRDRIQEINLVRSDSVDKLGPMLADWLKNEQNITAPIREVMASGCMIDTQGGLHPRSQYNRATYETGFTNSTLENAGQAVSDRLDGKLERGSLSEAHYRGATSVADIVCVDTPPRAPLVGMSVPGVSEILRASVSEQLGNTDIAFGLRRNAAVETVSKAADAHGFETVTITANADKSKLSVSGVGGDGQTLEFSVNNRVLTAVVPSLAAPPLPEIAPPSTASTPSGSEPRNLYQQALSALGSHHETLSLKVESQQLEVAREIASQANRDGLSSIARIELATSSGSGKPMLIAYEDGAAKQSQPIEAEALQKRVGAVEPTISQESPTKERAQQL